jgi:hypothetical protein
MTDIWNIKMGTVVEDRSEIHAIAEQTLSVVDV